MGCNIHALIEQKDKKHDWSCWINRGDPEIDRDYRMFSILANVRNGSDIPFIAEHRGISKDSCYAFKHWHGDIDSKLKDIQAQKSVDFTKEPDDKEKLIAWWRKDYFDLLKKYNEKLALIGRLRKLVK